LKKLHRDKAAVDKLKNDDFVAMEYRCNVNIALEKGHKDNQQELPNDRWKHFRDTVTACNVGQTDWYTTAKDLDITRDD